MNRLDFSFGFCLFSGDTGVGEEKCMNRVEWVLVGPGTFFKYVTVFSKLQTSLYPGSPATAGRTAWTGVAGGHWPTPPQTVPGLQLQLEW